MVDSLKEKSNIELMDLYKHGQILAFEEIYNRFEARVFSYLMKRLHKKEIADEVFQNVFLKFHEVRDQYEQRYKLEQWIFTITRSVMIDFLRKENRHGHEAINDSAPVLSEEGVSDFFEDEKLILNRAKEGLSQIQNQVIDMKIIDELDYKDIARHLKTSEMNARKIFSRGFLQLKNLIGRSA